MSVNFVTTMSLSERSGEFGWARRGFGWSKTLVGTKLQIHKIVAVYLANFDPKKLHFKAKVVRLKLPKKTTKVQDSFEFS